MTALANLLPGIRDLRAPLAAGYIWLLGLWLAIESEVPGESDANGLLDSVYRLGDGLSAIGLGVVASFVAYVLGSLSTSLFAAPSTGLRRLSFLSRWLRLDPFSAQARDALSTLSRNTRLELENILSMSGTDVEQLLDESLGMTDSASKSDSKVFPATPSDPRQWSGPGYATARDLEGEQEESISRAVIRDLDTIATTRLLGKDQELYSAVDRLRAETEFRRAIVPPMVFGSVVVMARTGFPWPVVVGVAVAALSLGLLVDAARLERRANDLLLDVVTDDRVQSPTLERLRGQAHAIVNRTAADDAEQAASRLAAAIKRAARRLERVGNSEPSLANAAKEDAVRAQIALGEAESRLERNAVELGRQVVTELNRLADAWVAAMKGTAFEVHEANEALGRAESQYEQFLRVAKQDVAVMREQTPART